MNGAFGKVVRGRAADRRPFARPGDHIGVDRQEAMSRQPGSVKPTAWRGGGKGLARARRGADYRFGPA
ncbi:hypothetical protein WOC76_16010 [Methylocystis sp. IM3]|uniref:hypothetical protein n=1 Tax=unclassified Methylocystis TaxID=2625913 RepID=UPI000FB9E638|nr:MAG: hypothetical protein EKK29_08745 [Hyphomicrobiales bacterium]